MPLALFNIELLLPLFGLVLARVAGVVFAIPLLTSRQVPRVAKAWLIVTLSLLVFPAVAPSLPQSLTLGALVAGLVGEFVIGEVMGLGAGVVFLAAQIAGKLISHQSGMALSQSFNPVLNVSSTVLDQVYFFSVMMFFLAMRGHLAVVKVLLDSFKSIPPMMMFTDDALAEFLIGILQSTFNLALRMSGPVVLALLLTSLIMGLLTKTMPQLNILSVGFSFKIATGIFIMAMTIPFAGNIVATGLADGLDQIGLLFEHCAETVTHAG